MRSNFTWIAAVALASLAALAPPDAQACSTCGCTLNADWVGQGLRSGDGLNADVRIDVFDQTDLRSGTRHVDASAIALPSTLEVQRKTMNRDATLTVDYVVESTWGVTLQVPYVNRDHATFAPGDVDLSTSRSSGVGDVRVLGRYQGFSPDRDWGLQFGVKLPTGRTRDRFSGGPQAGEPLDRGLQPGSGSTDLLLGAYRFGAFAPSLDHFAQAILQLPVAGQDQFRPGAGLNVTFGVRDAGRGPLVPQLQINVRAERRETGANADTSNSGATLAYVSPGITWRASPRLQVYAFAQAPVYQRVNGLQLEPRVSLSLGVQGSY